MRDVDDDGYGESNVLAPVVAGGDCLDSDPNIYTGAAINEPTLCTMDADGDGYGPVSVIAALDMGTDCDDSDATISGQDADGDGFFLCANDCDDNDATKTPEDADGDGSSTCRGL